MAGLVGGLSGSGPGPGMPSDSALGGRIVIHPDGFDRIGTAQAA